MTLLLQKNEHEPLYTQDQEMAQKDLEIRVLKNDEDCRENIQIIEGLFIEIDEAKDQLERKNHESTILKKELARRIKENIFNKEKIAKMDQEIAKKAKEIFSAFMDGALSENHEEMMK